MMEAKKNRYVIRPILALLLLFAVVGVFVYADPTGVSITYNSTDSGPTVTAGNDSQPGGTITTMVLNVVQQNSNWKAYIGNITGTLTLDDSNSRTIFDWTLSAASITGEIYASRASSPTWGSVNCSNITTVAAEETALGHTPTAADSIRNTFNETTHTAMTTAGRTMPADSCNATSTFEDDARVTQASANFQELLLHDTTNIIYATAISQDTASYNGSETVDFQMIVADDTSATASTYYFFAEISG